MKTAGVFQNYELLADKADQAFVKMKEEHGECMTCRPRCSDCCHAVFGVFLIEAAYIKEHFDQLDRSEIKEALLRCNDTERALKRLEVKLKRHQDDQQMQLYTMATERIRCPLLNGDEECILYPHRPITCRVYGIPTKIQGKARVCGNAGFEKGAAYPAYDLDGAYRTLFLLSQELLKEAGREDMEKASLLISVPKALQTPVEELINETLE